MIALQMGPVSSMPLMWIVNSMVTAHGNCATSLTTTVQLVGDAPDNAGGGRRPRANRVHVPLPHHVSLPPSCAPSPTPIPNKSIDDQS